MKNSVLNVGLLVAISVAAILAWAFFSRVSVERPDPRRLDSESVRASDIIQIEVLNGCGVGGIARSVRDYFVEMGFDVVAVDNYSRMDVEKTFVIDRAGNKETARQVAVALGVSDSTIVVDVKSEYYLDAVVVLGRDYADLRPFTQRENQ